METKSPTTNKTSTALQQLNPACPECRRSPILQHHNTSFVLPMRRRPFQRVHFSPLLVNKNSEADSKNVFASPHKELTEEMIHETWYSHNEIARFQKRAKVLVALSTKFPTLDHSKLTESMLGLERHNPKRAEFKRAAIKFILEAQQTRYDPCFLPAVAQKCSAWAKKAAIHMAMQNYCDVYHSSSSSKSHFLCSKSSSTTLGNDSKETNNHQAVGTKRKLPEETTVSSNKRQRIARSA
eukprot:CAMPEP_0113633096 /NCGR_PEP_ID=MMETSP0017_2-20120614/17215_1 /TAXON_ID=2856 /ORGANISM="Cylindrotheca closterium" /LENGTH=238 /DNA_ID=CAMNT_0000543703 /DNA_START=41 /DNA_END=757 /DNA_ORIENTATION=+ /assembly_acc=CAM_ASM_000147